MNPKVLPGCFVFLLALIPSLPAADVAKVDPDEVISVDFPNEERLVIFRNVADLYELNLVVPDSLENDRVSMKLRNVTWRQIFDVGLKNSGYTWYSQGNIVYIVQLDDPSQEIALIREKLETASDDNVRLRKAMNLLLEDGALPLSPDKRAKLVKIVSDPKRPASEILAALYSK